MNYSEIISELKQKKYAPVYFLYGDEAYFIDKISDYIEKNGIAEHERDFNQTVFYGKDSKVEHIIETCKRFPMMAEKQVVLVKEAQHLSKYIADFEGYFNNPQPSTILVICYKYKKPDKRTSLGKMITKHTVSFNSELIKDYKLPEWIGQCVSANKFNINPKNTHLLAEYLGNDLGKIEKEIEKLKVLLPPGSEIDSKAIEEHIGISKEYNVFELQTAIGTKNMEKAARIVQNFSKNEKAHPLVMTIGSLYSYFTKVCIAQFSTNKNNDQALAREIGTSPYFLKDYKVAIRNYSAVKLVKIIGYLREYDLKSKGVKNTSASQGELLRELLFKIMH